MHTIKKDATLLGIATLAYLLGLLLGRMATEQELANRPSKADQSLVYREVTK